MFTPSSLNTDRLERYHDMHVRPKYRLQGRSSLPIDLSAMKTSTWTYKPAVELQPLQLPAAAGSWQLPSSGWRQLPAEKQLCLRPERAARRPVQRLQWRRTRWPQDGQDDYLDLSRISSMTIADVSPKFAVKRILQLYENQQYREAASFVNRLSHGTFKVILTDLPVEVFVEALPDSIPVLEALYAKVFLSDGLNFSMKTLQPEAVVMQIVNVFAQQEDSLSGNIQWDAGSPFIASCKKLLKVIIHTDPKVRKMLLARRKALDKAIEGMGHHGMVGTQDGGLMNLHDALALEFKKVVASYKAALEKLEELALSAGRPALGRSISHGPAPVQVSHQRQLSITERHVQQRLIDNKTILNVVEPILGNHSLDLFLGILQRRIEHDKECLFQFTQLRREVKTAAAAAPPHQAVVAPMLMRYAHGIDQVLHLMREVCGESEDSDGSDISGYHSDSDSAIMTSGNSPYVSKSARYHFLYRSVRATPAQFRGRIPSFRGGPLPTSVSAAGSASASADGSVSGSVSGSVGGSDGSVADKSSISTDERPSTPERKGAGPSQPDRTLASASKEEHKRSVVVHKDDWQPPTLCRDDRQQSTEDREEKRAPTLEREGKRSHKREDSANRVSSASTESLSDVETVCSKGHSLPITDHVTVRPDVPQSSEGPQFEPRSAPNTTDRAQPKLKLADHHRKQRIERAIRVNQQSAPASAAVCALPSLPRRALPLPPTPGDTARSDGPHSRSEVCVTGGEPPPTEGGRGALVRRFQALYGQSRTAAMRALDQLPELSASEELKSKLLFSVVVLAFRSVTACREAVRETVRRQLQIPPPPPPTTGSSSSSSSSCQAAAQRSRQLEDTVSLLLQQTADTYDLSNNVQEVCAQIWATLYDYPCLRTTDCLLNYVKESVRLSWALINQSPPCRIEYEVRQFDRALHARQGAGSDPTGQTVITYLWPALMQGATCLHRAVVIT